MDIDSATDFYPLGDNILIQGGFEWMQGVACFEGSLCVTSDDGDADENAPDTMYRVDPEIGIISFEKALKTVEP